MSINRRKFLKLTGATVAASQVGACAGIEKIPTQGVPRSNFDED